MNITFFLISQKKFNIFILFLDSAYFFDFFLYYIYMESFDIQKDLENGLKNKEFQVYLQPKFDCRTEKMVGAEALVRRVTNGILVMPDSFISFYEQAGIITYLDNFVLEEVCKLLQKWQEFGKYCYVSVNESAKHLSNKNHGIEVMKILNHYKVSPHFIELEVTESAIIHDMELAKKAEERMHELGFIISMDDFGVGYSSFSVLKNIPIDVLKIDKIFLEGLLNKRRFQIILESIIDMAHKLRMITVMEGVENKKEVEYLKEIGCDILQGYYFDKPLPVQEFEKKYIYHS